MAIAEAAAPEADPIPEAELSPVRLGARWILGCFLVTFGIYVLFVPRILRFSSPPTGDQAFYLMTAASLAEDGDLDLHDNYAARDEDKFYALAPHGPDFVGMSAPYPLPQHLAASSARPADEWYPYQHPGLPLLLAPVWKLGGLLALWWPATVLLMVAVGAVVATQVFLLALEVGGRKWIAIAVWLALALSHPLMTYSYLIFTELTCGLLLVYAFRRLASGWSSNGTMRRVAIGAAIGYLPWLAWRCVALAAALAVYAAVQWWRRPRAAAVPGGRARDVRGALALALPVLASATLLLRYHWFLFGRAIPPIRVPEADVPVPFHWPWSGIDAFASCVANGFALLFDVQWGLIPYAPVLLLAGVGGVALLRSGRRADRRLVAALALVAPYLLVLVSYRLWDGRWCPPARFLTTLVPLAAAPLAAGLRVLSGWRGRLYELLFSLAVAWGGSIEALFLLDPRLMWPSGMGMAFAWLAGSGGALSRFDLRGWLPSYVRPDELRHPWQAAAAAGVALAIVGLGVALTRPREATVAPPWPASRRRRRWREPLTWCGAILAVAGGWWMTEASYLAHRTTLVVRREWKLPVVLHDPCGIAFRDGRIFVASYGERFADGTTGPGDLGELDLSSGSYREVVAHGPEGTVAWAHPGDVESGPGGLLYVLNNGPGDAALLSIAPDGGIVDRLALVGVSPYAKGSTSLRTGTCWSRTCSAAGQRGSRAGADVRRRPGGARMAS